VSTNNIDNSNYGRQRNGKKEFKEILKEQNRIASSWLIHYGERKLEHEQQREELVKKPELHVKNTFRSKPTETLAIKLAEHDDNDTARWLWTIEEVKRILAKNKSKSTLLKLRQECQLYSPPYGGRPSWIAPVQIRFGELTDWCPPEQTLRNMWSDIVALTVRLAYLKKCKI
jgi:hypothetical protein